MPERSVVQVLWAGVACPQGGTVHSPPYQAERQDTLSPQQGLWTVWSTRIGGDCARSSLIKYILLSGLKGCAIEVQAQGLLPLCLWHFRLGMKEQGLEDILRDVGNSAR